MAKAIPLEECFDEIEAVIDALESGDLPLDDAFQRYEQGLARLRQARRQLEAYRSRFAELQDVDDDGVDATARDA